MANRMFNQFRYSMEKAVVDLYAKVSIGTTGAPTVTRAKGITSVTRTSAGLYVITLQDTYNTLLGVTATQILASGFPGAPAFFVVSETVGTTKLITVQFAGPTGTADTALKAVELTDGAKVMFHITLSNSSAT